MIEILWPAFVLSLMLVFIHAIFGLEIIRRGVIFTDLAIGQIAAVGVAVSLLLFEGRYMFLSTFAFALSGAFLIAYASGRVKHIEAFIGMLYALGTSSIMVILSNTSDGMELFNKLLATDILFVTSDDLLVPAFLYSFVAVVFFFVLNRFHGFAKELLFFSLLALVVTSSVQLAGVLVVFVLLIVPSFIALLQERYQPLGFAWIVGTLIMMISLGVSYQFDLPTGYGIVFIASLTGVIGALFSKKSVTKRT